MTQANFLLIKEESLPKKNLTKINKHNYKLFRIDKNDEKDHKGRKKNLHYLRNFEIQIPAENYMHPFLL